MRNLINNVFALQIPSMAFGLMINNYGDSSELMYMLDIEEIDETNKTDETLITKPLPPGQWEFICTSIGATEEEAASIVQYIEVGRFAGYPDYETPANDVIPIEHAINSLRTLLRSKGLEGNYALLRKL